MNLFARKGHSGRLGPGKCPKCPLRVIGRKILSLLIYVGTFMNDFQFWRKSASRGQGTFRTGGCRMADMCGLGRRLDAALSPKAKREFGQSPTPTPGVPA